jgi:hypothetical protein
MSTQLINALLEERRGYVMRGKVERVRDVDAELARLGYEQVEAPVATDSDVVPAPGRVDTNKKKKPARKKV